MPQELELYVRKAVTVADGVLELRTRRETIQGPVQLQPCHTRANSRQAYYLHPLCLPSLPPSHTRLHLRVTNYHTHRPNKKQYTYTSGWVDTKNKWSQRYGGTSLEFCTKSTAPLQLFYPQQSYPKTKSAKLNPLHSALRAQQTR